VGDVEPCVRILGLLSGAGMYDFMQSVCSQVSEMRDEETQQLQQQRSREGTSQEMEAADGTSDKKRLAIDMKLEVPRNPVHTTEEKGESYHETC
jgi:hypothetical protein